MIYFTYDSSIEDISDHGTPLLTNLDSFVHKVLSRGFESEAQPHITHYICAVPVGGHFLTY